MKEAYLFYTELNDKNEIHFQYYTECSSTLNAYNEEIFNVASYVVKSIFRKILRLIVVKMCK